MGKRQHLEPREEILYNVHVPLALTINVNRDAPEMIASSIRDYLYCAAGGAKALYRLEGTSQVFFQNASGRQFIVAVIEVDHGES